MAELLLIAYLVLAAFGCPIFIAVLWIRQNESRKKDMAFADSLATLTADIQKLIAEGSPAAITAAVAAKDASDAAAVDSLDAQVKQALTPPAPAA